MNDASATRCGRLWRFVEQSRAFHSCFVESADSVALSQAAAAGSVTPSRYFGPPCRAPIKKPEGEVAVA